MSGGKGTSSTPVTQTATNPLAKYVTGAAEYLTPYAQDPNRPYTAPPNPYQTSGYNNLATTGYNIAAGLQPAAYDAYAAAQQGAELYGAGGAGPQHNADIWGNQAATGNIPNAVNMANYANQATAGNVGQDQLAAVAQGKYTDASSNPYLRDMVNAALRPVSENYQTSTAPTLDARFSAGGRYGSGAADQAAGSARDAFARNLGEISTGMYGKEYQFERGQQDTAAQQYDAARRAGLGLGITGLQAAGNLTDQGLRTALSAADLTQRGQLAGIQSGFQGTQQYPQFAQSQFIMPRAEIEAGTGLRDLDTSVNREPYDRVNAYLKSISGAGANAAGSSSTTPYYTNDIASAISGLSGAASLGKQLGIGNLFSGGGASTSAVENIINGGITDFGGGGGLAESFAPVLSASDYALPALGGAGGGKAAAEAVAPLAIASDRRLKEDYKIIGKVGALPLYSFRYKGDPTPRIGFMADEVEQIDPGAVHTMAGGFKAVDYERAVKSALK